MSDDENYKFSDDEDEMMGYEEPSPQADDADEQQSQKISSQLTSLEEALRKCKLELEEERKSHADTKRRAADNTDNHDQGRIAELEEQLRNVQKSEAEYKAKYEQASRRSNPSFDKLKETVAAAALQHNLGDRDAETMTEQDCIDVISSISRKLEASKKKKEVTMERQSSSMADVDLRQRVANLEEELRLALGAAEDIRALKAKAMHLVERIRSEKEERLRVEQELKTYNKKMQMLSDHIEKLMIHLKHEAAHKIKALDQVREVEKKLVHMTEKYNNLNQKSGAKDRLIAELREGSKILEDQLRLMDEKYLELRTKLDYARESAAKKIKVAQKTATDLRVKFALAGNTTLLDHMQLPDIGAESSHNSSNAFNEGFSTSKSLSQVGKSRSHNKMRKKKSANQDYQQTMEESTGRVLDKIRKLRGGKTEWTEEKMRNLASTR